MWGVAYRLGLGDVKWSDTAFAGVVCVYHR